MKKIICLVLLTLMLFSCLTSCALLEKAVKSIMDKSESTPKATEMMTALSEGRAEDAKALLHPDIREGTDDAIEQMIEFVNGREIDAVTMTGVKIYESVGTNGKVSREECSFSVTFKDGSSTNVSSIYVTSKDGEGFESFQFSIGAI